MHRMRPAFAGAVMGAVMLSALVASTPLSPRVAAARVPGAPTTPIEHVVFILKENRSFDHYFGRFPGANGTTVARCWTNSGVRLIDPMPKAPDPMPQDVSHANSTFYTAYHGGAMDGFCHENGAIVTSTGKDIADTQMRKEQIPNYWKYAQTYGLGDRMFASWRGASFANNVFAVAAQAGRYDDSINNRTIFGNPKDPAPGPTLSWGCDNSVGTTAVMMGVKGAFSKMYPCYDFPALPNLLDTHGLSWKFYSSQGSSHFVHSGIAAIRSIRCRDADTPPCGDSPYWSSHVPSTNQFLTDAAAGNLPAVSWYLPSETEHPPKTACAGENSTVGAVNAVMSGADWESTAIVILWDEWGGFYDHVKPPTAKGINANVSYGFRVPLLVISPWTKVGASVGGGYVSHKFTTQASLLRLVEALWDLPTLGAGDDPLNYAAREPVPGTLIDFFDFSDPLNPPKPDTMILQKRSCPALSGAQRWYIANSDPD